MAKPQEAEQYAFSIKNNGFNTTQQAIKEFKATAENVYDLAFSIKYHDLEFTKQAVEVSKEHYPT